MKHYFFYLIIFTAIFFNSLFAQDITVVPVETELNGAPGSTLTFHINVTNNTSSDLTLCIVRAINDLPDGWSSSICLDVCLSSSVDSVLTDPEFGSSPLTPSETREIKIITQSANAVAGSGHIQLKIYNFRNPAETTIVDLNASTTVTSVHTENLLNTYTLSQNYPNPFNPSTNLSFSLAESGNVSIKVFDLLGRVVAVPVNEFKTAGKHTVTFDASALTSGTYFYKIETNNFTETKKMILEK